MEESANLVVRLPKPLHHRVKLAATVADRTIQAWVEDALRMKLAKAQEPAT